MEKMGGKVEIWGKDFIHKTDVYAFKDTIHKMDIYMI